MFENVENIISLIALIIAIYALLLQRKEIIKNGKINTLIHVSNLLQNKIDYHNKIIENMINNSSPTKPLNKKSFDGHQRRINEEFRPEKLRIDTKLLELMEKYEKDFSSDHIKELIKPQKSNQ